MSTVPTAATQHDIPDATPPERFIYVVQSVRGDPQQATVCYALTTDDGAEVVSRPVEMREGRYNVSGAFGGANYLSMAALDAAGNGRTLTMRLSELPPHCYADPGTVSVAVLHDCDAQGRIVLEASIVCAARI